MPFISPYGTQTDYVTPSDWSRAKLLAKHDPIPSSLELDGMRDPMAECEISSDITLPGIAKAMADQWG